LVIYQVSLHDARSTEYKIGKRRSSLGDTMLRNVPVCFTFTYAWSLHCLGSSITFDVAISSCNFFFLISVRTFFKKLQIACSLCWKFRLYYRSPSENSWGTEESAGGSSLGALSLSRSLLGARLSTWCASIFHQLSSSSAFSSETRAEFLLPPVKYQSTASGHPSRSTNCNSYSQGNSRLTL